METAKRELGEKKKKGSLNKRIAVFPKINVSPPQWLNSNAFIFSNEHSMGEKLIHVFKLFVYIFLDLSSRIWTSSVIHTCLLCSQEKSTSGF